VSQDAPPLLTVVISVGERPAPIADLYSEIVAALREAGCEFEVVVALEPGRRALVEHLRAEPLRADLLAVVEAARGGETSLLRVALSRARGRIILRVPGYHRVTPAALPQLLRRLEEGVDVASARRYPRLDGWFNRLQNRVFHWLANGPGPVTFHDLGCGVQAMRREVVDLVPLYGDLGRFLPLLAAREGFRVEEVPVEQHPADRATRIYAPGLYARRLLDLLGLHFLLRFTDKPLRFFGLVGLAAMLASFVLLAVLFIQRLGGRALADRPALLLAVLLAVLGVQALALGLLGEIIVYQQAPGKRSYRLRQDS
jgi:hypothetical protein